MWHRAAAALALAAWVVFMAAPAQSATVPVTTAAGAAADEPSLLEEQLEALNIDTLDRLLVEMSRGWADFAPELSFSEAIKVYTDGNSWHPRQILKGLFHYLFREVVANSGLLARLLVLAVLASLLYNVQGAFAQQTTGKLAHMVVYLVLAGVALSGFGLAVNSARQVIADLEGFMLALLPTLLAILIGTGGVTSAALLHPTLPVIVSSVAALTGGVIFPLIFLAAVMDIASGFNEHLKLTQLAALFRQGAMLVMGLAFTVFMGFTSVKAVAGAVGDSVALRSAKFLTGALVPVVGKMFADAAELVWSSGLLLKNAVGLVGLVAVFLIAAFPCLKILSITAVFRAAAALIQPMGQPEMAQCLNTMAGALMLVFAAVAVVALMFFIGVTIVIGAGNATVMMR